NYITKFVGTTIGACEGVKIDFEIQFIDKKFISAVLQAYPLSEKTKDKVYERVVLTAKSDIYSKTLEQLANASTCGSGQYGHTLSLTPDGYLTVTFYDTFPYFPNAGIVVVYNIEKTKYN
ncbi:hypothetical protein IUY40_16230, partial [Flavobacterium sp. ALJ2]|uniref:hypothetical protein n=1 Tax=Flavobacterium sp. ALJ2 TaxID=2786960 RepID=UPI00189CFFA8